MMAVCGWEPQPHVPNGMKGQTRMQKSSNGSAYTLASPLSVSHRVIELFAKWQAENATTGMTWNEAAKCAAARQVMQPPPHPDKVVEPNTASSSSAFEQYTLLDWLADAEAQSKPLDDAMVIDEPVKPVAGSSKHPNDVDVIDSELIY